jgi:hypothetical protein
MKEIVAKLRLFATESVAVRSFLARHHQRRQITGTPILNGPCRRILTT